MFDFTLPSCHQCFDVSPAGPPPVLPSCVVCELCWNLTFRPSGDDRPDESLNQYFPVFLLSHSFFPPNVFSLIALPASPRGKRSASAPSPSTLVCQCSGSTWGPAGSQSLRYVLLQPPHSYYQLPSVTNRGQPRQPAGGR